MDYEIKAVYINGEELYTVILNGIIKGTFDSLEHAMEYKHALEDINNE